MRRMRQSNWMAFLKADFRTVFCSSIVFAAMMFCSCSEDEEKTLPEPSEPSIDNPIIVGENSNMPSSGVIVSEFADSPDGYDAGKVVDGNLTTSFSVNKKTFYLMWKGDEATKVNSYSIASSQSIYKAPKGWILLGSNDEENWVTLDDKSDEVFLGPRQETKSYRFDNTKEYTCYQLEILDNNGDSSTEIAEWTLSFVDYSKPHSIEVSGNDNMPSTGVLTAQYSDYPIGADVSTIIDNNARTSYITSHDNFYLLWEGTEASKIWMYELTSAIDSPDKDPKAWSFYGSTDNKEWILLDTQENQTFSKRNETQRYEIAEQKVDIYQYYKLEITANNGGSTTQIAEFSIGCEMPHSVEVPVNATMPTAGVLTAQYSDYPTGSDIGAVVDGNDGTSYVTSRNSFYILWEGAEACEAWMYTLTSSDHSAANDPMSWDFYASHDGKEWILLDSQVYQKFSARRQTIRYQIPEERVDVYKYYKLEITANNGGNETYIAEYSLYVYPTSYDDLSDRFNYITKHPTEIMGTKFLDAKVREASDEQKAWLEDPTQEPDPTSGAEFKVEFNVNLYPYGEPKPSDINQHDLGDCGVVASFAGLAYQYPRYIKEYLIEEVTPRHFVVNMFDPRGKEIKVAVSNKFLTKQGSTQNMQTSGKAVSGDNRPANWGTILEKALMKYRQIYFGTSSVGGVMGGTGLPPFLGVGDSFNGAGYKSFALTVDELERVFKVALSKGEIVTVGFVEVDGNKDITVEGNAKIILNHAFTVMQTANPSCMIALRNPWGTWSGAQDGIVNVPMSDLVAKSINFMVIRPGKAGSGDYGPVGTRLPYQPPVFSATARAADDAHSLLRMQNGDY